MALESEAEIVLYDLACTKNVCFSPAVWRIRLMLNYKQIPYRTVFVEFPDIAPMLKAFGLVPVESATYTVPAIHHVPTNKYVMDSIAIASFLGSTYPEPVLPLTSELGHEIEARARSVSGKAFQMSLMPREIRILSPRSQAYFRTTREATLGHRLEDLLDADKEERTWSAADEGMRAVSDLTRTHETEGTFVLGARPSYTDFLIAGCLQCAKIVDMAVFERNMKYPGLKQIYQACLLYMEKKD